MKKIKKGQRMMREKEMVKRLRRARKVGMMKKIKKGQRMVEGKGMVRRLRRGRGGREKWE